MQIVAAGNGENDETPQISTALSSQSRQAARPCAGLFGCGLRLPDRRWLGRLPFLWAVIMKTIMDLAREANLPACHLEHPKALQRFADLLAKRELQACRDVLEGLHACQDNHNYYLYASKTLQDIRGDK